MRRLLPVIMTIFAASCLAVLPMPEWANWARPAWVLMVVMFWTLSIPGQVNVGFAFASGLWMDLLTGTLLGEHALAMTVVIYMVCRSHQRINMYPVMQQTLSVLFFVLVYQAVMYGVQGFIGQPPLTRMYWLTSLTSMLLWPWLVAMLRDYSQWMRLNLAKYNR